MKKNEQILSYKNQGRKKMVFQPGDWVWVHLRKERFPSKRASKLMPRGDGPFQVLERINDNAYKVDLPGEYQVSATFNVSDLTPFDVGSDSRTNPFEEGGDDASMEHEDVALEDVAEEACVPDGPMTRSRARKLQNEIRSLITSSLSVEHKEASKVMHVMILQENGARTIKEATRIDDGGIARIIDKGSSES